MLKQTMIITKLADRHAALHEREFAETFEREIDAGDYCRLDDLPVGRYIIVIEEPYE